MIISIKMIDRMFKENNDPNECVYRAHCLACGCEVEITIIKTSGGYGFKGGVLHEQDPRDIWASCDDCYAISGGSEATEKGPFTDAA